MRGPMFIPLNCNFAHYLAQNFAHYLAHPLRGEM